MTYEATLQYLYSQLPQFQLTGQSAYKPGLDNILTLDAYYGSPHCNYPCIHVAGTNGKGSVSHLLASVLQQAGYRVGLFTSPHLKDFRERIRVNGKMISKAAVVRFVQRYREHFTETEPAFQPSFFELTTEMAFCWFAEQKVDVAVIEVGLGGRLDSTNIITPVVSAITSISFDHVALLGDTLEKIAAEKAGIIKPGIPVAVARNPENVCEVLAGKAREVGSAYHYAPDEITLQAESLPETFSVEALPSAIASLDQDNKVPGGQVFQVQYQQQPWLQDLYCALGGWYVRENAQLVLTVIRLLARQFAKIDERAVRRGFERVGETGIRGRWEVLQTRPLCICDTGHNEAGIRQVTAQLARTPHQRLHVVFGVVNDKDVTAMLGLLPKDALYYFTKASVPRALPEEVLAEKAAAFGLRGQCYATVAEARQAALAAAADDDLIYIGGSNFIVAEL